MEEGTEPERPYSGKFNLRLSPELHKEVAIREKKLKISINRFVEKALTDEIAAMR
jgi:predicted HicB family RNase H-like nuclease